MNQQSAYSVDGFPHWILYVIGFCKTNANIDKLYEDNVVDNAKMISLTKRLKHFRNAPF